MLNTYASVWEQRKFGDIGSVSMCKRIFKEETSPEGDIPFFKIGTFGGEPDAYISRELFEEYKSKFSYPEEGTQRGRSIFSGFKYCLVIS